MDSCVKVVLFYSFSHPSLHILYLWTLCCLTHQRFAKSRPFGVMRDDGVCAVTVPLHDESSTVAAAVALFTHPFLQACTPHVRAPHGYSAIKVDSMSVRLDHHHQCI